MKQEQQREESLNDNTAFIEGVVIAVLKHIENNNQTDNLIRKGSVFIELLNKVGHSIVSTKSPAQEHTVKTLQEIHDEIAQKYKQRDWNDLEDFQKLIISAILIKELYASQFKNQSK